MLVKQCTATCCWPWNASTRGGVRLPGGARPLELLRFDSKGNVEEALAMLKAALDQRVGFVMQGNSSSAAAVLIDALNKHNEREPARRALFPNYSAVDPVLTNEKCSFWHFTLLIKAARGAGVDASFYTFYGNGLGAPAAIGDAGVGRVLAVAEWHPNVGTPASERFYASFRERFPKPQDDYVHARIQVMVEMLAAAMEQARSTDAVAVARALEGMKLDRGTLGGFHEGTMRAADHQFIHPLYVSVMERVGTAGVGHDNEGSGFGFKTMRHVEPRQTEQPTRCKMERP